MKRLLAFALVICLSMGAYALAEDEVSRLWLDYIKLDTYNFYYEDALGAESDREKQDILFSILKLEPESWIAYANLYFIECDNYSYCEYLTDVENPEMSDVKQIHLDNIERYESKAVDLLNGRTLTEIQMMNVPDPIKGFACETYGLLSDDLSIQREAYLLAIGYYSETESEIYPLFAMMNVLFGNGIPFREIWGSDEEHRLLYCDEDANYVCAKVLEEFDKILCKDINEGLKEQLFQVMIEANAYFAYSAYYSEDWNSMEECIQKSHALLSRCSDYDNRLGGVFNCRKVPVSDMYDAHIRALYHFHNGDEEQLEQDIKDFHSAYKMAYKTNPLGFVPYIHGKLWNNMMDMQNQMNDR